MVSAPSTHSYTELYDEVRRLALVGVLLHLREAFTGRGYGPAPAHPLTPRRLGAELVGLPLQRWVIVQGQASDIVRDPNAPFRLLDNMGQLVTEELLLPFWFCESY